MDSEESKYLDGVFMSNNIQLYFSAEKVPHKMGCLFQAQHKFGVTGKARYAPAATPDCGVDTRLKGGALPTLIDLVSSQFAPTLAPNEPTCELALASIGNSFANIDAQWNTSSMGLAAQLTADSGVKRHIEWEVA